jgi:hypothetical protein
VYVQANQTNQTTNANQQQDYEPFSHTPAFRIQLCYEALYTVAVGAAYPNFSTRGSDPVRGEAGDASALATNAAARA